MFFKFEKCLVGVFLEVEALTGRLELPSSVHFASKGSHLMSSLQGIQNCKYFFLSNLDYFGQVV